MNRERHVFAAVSFALFTIGSLACSKDTQVDAPDAGAEPPPPSIGAVPPDCDPIVPSHCGLPLPSSRWLADDPTTPTKKRVRFDPKTLPEHGGASIDPAAFADLDGFSPAMPILTHLPGATLTGVAGHDDIERSLADDSPTVLIDAESGARVPHWAELDMAVAADDDNRAFMIRPAVRLEASRRYIVAIRRIADASGKPLAASPAFAAIRDGRSDPAIDGRRAAYDDVFARLAKAGVKKDDLQIAWDWVTASREGTTKRLLAMRDDALAKVGVDGPEYLITSVEENPNPYIRRRIQGTMKAPSYLDRSEPGGRLVLGKDGLPVQNGTVDVPFVVHVPNSLVREKKKGALVMNGHGLLGSMFEGQNGYLAEISDAMGYVSFSCPLMGMAGKEDADFIVKSLGEDVTQFRSNVDRQHQGLLDELLLMRMMSGRFRNDPNVTFDGASVIDETLRFYRGDSQGGIFGTTYMAITTDVTRGLLGEPGMPYSLLFDRSVDFSGFGFILRLTFKNPIDVQIVYGLVQMLWDATEPAGYAPYIVKDMLPGTPAHRVLIHAALGDHQVSTLGAHMTARAVGAKSLTPAPRKIFGIEEASPPLADGSAIVEFDFGLPPDPVTNHPQSEGEDPHDKVRRLPESYKQADRFFRTGTIDRFCTGVCRFR